jgi:hypothetical protein
MGLRPSRGVVTSSWGRTARNIHVTVRRPRVSAHGFTGAPVTGLDGLAFTRTHRADQVLPWPPEGEKGRMSVPDAARDCRGFPGPLLLVYE